MTSHPAPLSFRGAGLCSAFIQDSRYNFAKMPRSSRGHHQPDDRNRLGLFARPRKGLHGKCRASERAVQNARVVKETVQRNFLHCERLIEGRVFFGHLTVPFRLHDGIVARSPVGLPEVNISGSAAIGAEYFTRGTEYQFDGAA